MSTPSELPTPDDLESEIRAELRECLDRGPEPRDRSEGLANALSRLNDRLAEIENEIANEKALGTGSTKQLKRERSVCQKLRREVKRKIRLAVAHFKDVRWRKNRPDDLDGVEPEEEDSSGRESDPSHTELPKIMAEPNRYRPWIKKNIFPEADTWKARYELLCEKCEEAEVRPPYKNPNSMSTAMHKWKKRRE